ncbi:MAG: ATP-dependent DNA helicase [Bdellovibrionaceae bacterium]|nr:ATP-dependent DNA helicase [Pseudobdellovibrionaceae bacterium]
MKTIPLSISEFALPVPRSGHIELHSGYGPLPDVGQEIHQAMQAKKAAQFPEFEAEKTISRAFERNGYRFLVSGRMDGFYDRQPALIEEIKSTYQGDDLRAKLEAREDHPYRLQLRTYGYFHWLNTQTAPRLSLLVVSSRTRQVDEIPVDLDRPQYEAWLDQRLNELVEEAKEFDKVDKRRRKTAKKFVFPFNEPRAGQLDLVETVRSGFEEKKPLLLQAPTGLGKTAGVLSPALTESLSRGQKTLYVTPKNSQHSVAEQAVRQIQATGGKVKSMTLTAKARLCLKDEVVCNPQVCEYARNYHDKVHRENLTAQLAKKNQLDARAFRRMGREHEVCPFELQMEVASRMDVVICDYNYIFSPRNSVARLSANGPGRKGSPNLVIDEAHNLAARAMEYFSPALSLREIDELRPFLGHVPDLLRRDLEDTMDRAADIVQAVRPWNCTQPMQVEFDAKPFLDFNDELSQLLGRYMESGAELQPKDAVLRFCNLWADFSGALENRGEGFFITYRPHPQGDSLKIICCDASEWLAGCYKSFANVVAFSATLKPFDYYSRLMGFDPGQLRTAEFASPFPRDRRKLLVIPQVSTKWSDRGRESGKIKDAIERIVALKPGNYFVFFPSFDFMRQVADLVQAPGFDVMMQEREMKSDRIEVFLERLRAADRPTLVFAVQGGVFAEGVDYPGDMLIGAIIVGPALPSFDFERELMRGYFEKNHGSGFDYAYTYPAMAKVVQSAGRVIRTPQDRGVIILMDRRFTQDSYVKSMPSDWLEDSVDSLVSNRVLGDLAEFWGKNDEPA